MFSYFEKGIKDTTPQRTIDLPSLIKIIRNNPQRISIEHIRTLRKSGDEYRQLKRKLPNITPNCRVKYRNFEGENFEMNFVGQSGYIYFDTDDVTNVKESKEEFIKKYGHLVSMVCKSSSCGGLSILFKLEDIITIKSKEQFFGIWEHIRTTILKDEKIDTDCKDFGRSMYISYDPDVYVNFENEIKVELNDTKTIEKRVNQCKAENGANTNTLVYSFSKKKKEKYSYREISINDVLKKLITKTRVIVENPIVDFKPIEYARVFNRKIILDGKKRRTYRKMIHQLVYLNPDIDRQYILSYLTYVNYWYAKPRMNEAELVRLFDHTFDNIKSTGIIFPKTTIKNVHFREGCKLKRKEKINIANKLNGYYCKSKTIQKIIEAKEKLSFMGIKITQKDVARISGLSIKTVQTRFNDEPINMVKVVENFNDPSFLLQNLPPEPLGVDLRQVFIRNNTFTSPEDFIHPECPQWVLDYSFLNN